MLEVQFRVLAPKLCPKYTTNLRREVLKLMWWYWPPPPVMRVYVTEPDNTTTSQV